MSDPTSPLYDPAEDEPPAPPAEAERLDRQAAQLRLLAHKVEFLESSMNFMLGLVKALRERVEQLERRETRSRLSDGL